MKTYTRGRSVLITGTIKTDAYDGPVSMWAIRSDSGINFVPAEPLMAAITEKEDTVLDDEVVNLAIASFKTTIPFTFSGLARNSKVIRSLA